MYMALKKVKDLQANGLKEEKAKRNGGNIADITGTFFFFCVPKLYLWGSPFLGEIFANVTVF